MNERHGKYDEAGPETSIQNDAKCRKRWLKKQLRPPPAAGWSRWLPMANNRLYPSRLKHEVVDPEDVEMLQDLILAAVNDALAKSQEMVTSEMGKLTGGLNIPGLM